MKRVEMLAGVNYEGVVEKGLAVSFGEKREKATVLEVDTIVLCAGQESLRELGGAAQRGAAPRCTSSAARPWPASWTPSAPSTRGRGSPRGC